MEIYIAKNKTQMGPYDVGQVAQMLQTGILEKYDLYWHEGMLDWAPVAALKPPENNAPTPHPVHYPQNIQTSPIYSHQGYIEYSGYFAEAKSRISYIILGFFLGMLGIHNFYAGYTQKAVIQLLIVLLTGWTGVTALAVCIWVIVEICTVKQDAKGIPFK